MTARTQAERGSRRISPSMLKVVLEYDPETGRFIWKERKEEMFPSHFDGYLRWWNAKYAGTVAFADIDIGGYRKASILGAKHRGARVAWAYVTGEWPSLMIDHINGVKSDDRFCNLREASSGENNRNRPGAKGTSKYKGVHWRTRERKWIARIEAGSTRKHLGSFDCEVSAAQEYDRAAIEIHGEFAHLNFSAGGNNAN